eukprot:Phypoly_transcript_02176.p1 GENE.Phypoly_transcript_02176~~Phypoly_transcript_02176.p1  ORF type:complete len:910 (+),score=222.59 Phypoly_transcript_02176:75-2804(+)
MVSPQSLLDTFSSIENRTLSDAILKSSMRRMAHNGIHQQLLLARSLLFPPSPDPSASSSFSPFSTSFPPGAPPERRFSFKGKSGRLDWSAIENLDLDRIFREGSVDKIEPLVGNIAFSEVALDPFVKYATPEFIKAFNLSQMLVQYLNFQSETLVAKILQMNDEYVQVTAGHEKEKLIIQERETVKTEEVELLKKHIQKVTDELQTILKEYTKLDQLVKKYSKKCPVCDRLFFQPINLEKHILQRHPSITQNLEVQALMEEFAKLVGPSSDIYRSEKLKLEQSLIEIQKLKASLMEETRRIQEKDALIEKKLEASLQGQERERKYTETLQDFERMRQEQEKRTEEELRNLQQTLSGHFQKQIRELREAMEEDALKARQDEADRIRQTFEVQIDKLTAQMRLQQENDQRKMREERDKLQQEHERLQEEHERILESMKGDRDDILAQLQESIKKKEDSLTREQTRTRQLEENQEKLQTDLMMAARRSEQLQAEIEKLKAQKPIVQEPVPPIVIEPPPPPKPAPVVKEVKEEEPPEIYIPKSKEFTPMTHRPYLKTYFPYTPSEIAYYRNEILLALQREMEARKVEINPKTGGITKKEKERLMLEIQQELLGKPDARDFELMRTEVLREIEYLVSDYHTPPPVPSTPPPVTSAYPPTPPPISATPPPRYPPTPPPNVTPTPYLSPHPDQSLAPSPGPETDENFSYSHEESKGSGDEFESEDQMPKKRRPSIERDHSKPLRAIPEDQDLTSSFTLDPYSKSPVLTRKRIWRRSPNESDDAMVEMGVTDSQDSLALSGQEESPSSSPTLKRRGASAEREKPARVSPVSRFRRSMASDTSQHIDLITELQKHNTYVSNKNANKNTNKPKPANQTTDTQANRQSPTKKNTTKSSVNNSRDTSDNATYSDFDDDSYT